MDKEELKEKISEWKERLQVDPENLEKACQDQLGLYDEIGQCVVELSTEFKLAKANLDLVEAELQKKVRQSPSEFGVDKPTESAIQAVIRSHDAYKTALQEMIEAERLYKSVEVLEEVALQRKGVIRALVDLYIHNYYATQKDLAVVDDPDRAIAEAIESKRRIKDDKSKESPDF